MSKAKKYISTKKEKSNFYHEIKDKNKAFVLFYASWCPFSIEFLPIFEEYKKSNPKDCLNVIIDDKPDVCEEYSLEYYPTVILFKKGKVHKRLDARPGIGLNKKQLKTLVKTQ
jgi:thiol-disulfide isomerase/thioredoxin